MASSTSTALTFYKPHEVAEILGCSEWWVKEQARHQRIPFCWIASSYRFTPEHVVEIARLTEVRPAPAASASSRTVARAESTTAPVVQLTARVPRRARRAAA